MRAKSNTFVTQKKWNESIVSLHDKKDLQSTYFEARTASHNNMEIQSSRLPIFLLKKKKKKKSSNTKNCKTLPQFSMWLTMIGRAK